MAPDRTSTLPHIKVGAGRALRHMGWAWEARGGFAQRYPQQQQPLWILVARHDAPVSGCDELEDLRVAAAAVDRVAIAAGETLSLWHLVGDPGSEHGDCSQGACICVLAGALFQVGLQAGLTVVEHHHRALTPAPRGRPLGIGAAVVYPEEDLRLRNDFGHTVQIRAFCRDSKLVVMARAYRQPQVVVTLEQRQSRIEKVDGVRMQTAELWRRFRNRITGDTTHMERILIGRIPVSQQRRAA